MQRMHKEEWHRGEHPEKAELVPLGAFSKQCHLKKEFRRQSPPMVDQRLTVRAVPTVQLEFEDSSKNTQWGEKVNGWSI